MTRALALLLAGATCVAGAGCGRASQSPGAPAPAPGAAAVPAASPTRVPAPTWDEMAAGTYRTLREGEALTLAAGVWEGAPAAPGAASRPRAELLRGLHATGDLDGDGADEAVGVVLVSGGGSGTDVSLVAVRRAGGRVEDVARAPLGDRVQLKAARIEGGQLVAEVVRHGPDDPQCCPTARARVGWTLTAGAFREVADTPLGTLSLDDLAGPEWTLTHWSPVEPVGPGQAPVTLVWRRGSLAGRAGCGRYTAAADPRGPGRFFVSRVLQTRETCEPAATAAGGRFLTLLPKLEGYAFLAGDLLLTHDDGILRFTARNPGPEGQSPVPK